MTSTALVARTDVPPLLAERLQLAEQLADSGMLPDHLRGKKASCLAIQFAAAALDVPLWTAIQELYVIKGKVGMSALMMRGLIVNRGHIFNVLESDAHHATVQIHRAGEHHPRPAVTYTFGEATTAGLLKDNSNYAKNPTSMMLARATSRAARLYTPDVVLGFGYTVDELRDGTDQLPDPVVVTIVPDGATAEGTPADPSAPVEYVAPADVEVLDDAPALPETFDAACAEVSCVRPGTTAKSRKAADEYLRLLWKHCGHASRNWINQKCQDGKPLGSVILDRQQWLKTAPFDQPEPELEPIETPPLNAPATVQPKQRRTTAKAGR